MKKLLLLTLSLASVLVVFAGPVSEQQALQKARQFMPGKNLSMTQRASQAGLDYGSTKPFYVFNAENNGGFVIVSGDDRAKAILGYADKGSIDLNHLPDNVAWWLGYYTEAMTALQKSSVKQKSGTQTAKSTIPPLLKTTWDQSGPYWDQCLFDNDQCLTGCVATATAQVMNYYQYPSKAPAMDGYELYNYDDYGNIISTRYTIPALPGATLSWSNMCNNYTGSETKAQKKAVATLMRYCGQSVEMDYGTDGSGAVTAQVATALVNHFKYSNSTHAIIRDGFDPDEWENVIYQELAAKNPVIYAGRGTKSGGHCFVTDGYENGLFHVNWGWGGACDGHFVLNIMDAYGSDWEGWADYAFSNNQLAIVGVKAEAGGTADFPIMTVSRMDLLSDNELTRESTSDDFGEISIAAQFDYTPNTDNAFMNEIIALYKGDELVEILNDCGSWTTGAGWFWTTTFSPYLGANLADGKYHIEAVYKDENGTIHKSQGFGYHYIEAVIKGNKLTLTNYPLIGVVKLNKTKATIVKGKTLTLKATVTPSTMEDKTVTWKSSNKSVATVTSAGKVKGIKAGTATITCTSSTGLSATCKVTVADVTLNQSEAIIEKGKTLTLEATVAPSSISDKSVTWKSSNTAVATVSSKGKVKGVKAGTATITCTSVATGAKATCKVTVGYVKLDQTEAIVEKTKSMTLTATVYPSKLEDKSVTWKSSNTSVATVSSKGKVKGVKAGTATITCTSKATGLSTTCKVTVGYVKLDQTEVSVKKGKTVTLTATVYPSKLEDKSVTWKSSDTKIATVTSSGKVKGIKAGTATITCTSNATGLSTTCKVTVTATSSTRSLEGDDDEVTGIENLDEALEPFDVYDLSGRKVLNQVTSLDGLPRGIYIVNGKKVIKR